MNIGETLFAQLMDFLPWSTFVRLVERYDGDHRVRTLSCVEQTDARFSTVELAEVYERVNKRGQRNFVGRVGSAKILIIPTNEVSRGEPIWWVILGEAPYFARDTTELMQGLDATAATAR